MQQALFSLVELVTSLIMDTIAPWLARLPLWARICVLPFLILAALAAATVLAAVLVVVGGAVLAAGALLAG